MGCVTSTGEVLGEVLVAVGERNSHNGGVYNIDEAVVILPLLFIELYETEVVVGN